MYGCCVCWTVHLPDHEEALVQRDRREVEDGGEHGLEGKSSDAVPVLVLRTHEAPDEPRPTARGWGREGYWEWAGPGGEDWGGAGSGDWVGLEAGQGQAHLHCGDDEAPVHDELAERRRALVATATVHHEQAAYVLEPCDGEVGCQRGLPPLLQGQAGCSGPAEPTGQ